MNTSRLPEALDDLAQQAPRPDLAEAAWRQARRRRRAAITAGVVAVVAVGAASWSLDLGAQSQGQVTARPSEVPFAIVDGAAGVPLGGIDVGMLALHDGCLYMRQPGGDGIGHPVLLPRGASWDPERQQVSLRGDSVRVGEIRNFTGGYFDKSFGDHIPAACRDAVKTKRFLMLGTLVTNPPLSEVPPGWPESDPGRSPHQQ